MRLLRLLIVLTCLHLLQLRSHNAIAQLCAGSLGDPVVHITFGSGGNPGPMAGTTTMNYLSQDCPSDGQYTIRNSTNACFGATWHTLARDHTGDPNGYFMLVNASFQPADFYTERVVGLCGNTTYEFAAWIVNVLRPVVSCGGGGIKPNISFTIETLDGTRLAQANSGDIDATSSPEWKQYGMFFTTPPNTSQVVVRMRNNAPGGCGNDLALDDITFRPCGAKVSARIDGIPSGKTTVCVGAPTSLTLSATVSGGVADPDVLWQESRDGGASWRDIAGASRATYVWNGRPVGTYLYRMVVAEKGNIASTNCRVASSSVEVKVSPPPLVDIGDLITACGGDQLSINGNVSFPDSARGTIRWTLPPGVSLNFTTLGTGGVLISQSEAQRADRLSGFYRLDATSATGCTGYDSAEVRTLAKPVADFTVPTISCTQDTLTFLGTATTNAGSINAWQWQAGNAGGNQEQFRAVFPAGPALVRLWVKAANGCVSDTVQKNIQVKPKPVVGFTMPEVCLADPFAQFQSTATVSDGSTLSYRWNFGDAANPNAGATIANPRYRYGRVGVYPVRLTVTSGSGCTADTVQPLTINGSAPRAAFALAGSAVLCSADSVVIRNNATVDFGTITRLVIRWKNDNDATALTIDEEPRAGKTYAFSYAPFVTSATRRVTIRFTVFSGVGCVSETTREITLNQSPQVVLDSLPPVCADVAPFRLTQGRETNGLPGVATYTGNGVAANFFNPASAGAGSHPIFFRFAAANGCTDTASQLLQVLPVPRVSAGPDRTVVAGGSVQLQGTASGNGVRFSWSPPTALVNANTLTPTAAPTSDQRYRLAAISADGCTAFDEVAVGVIPDLYVPNAFTPNGDGINDTWQVPHLESTTDASLTVYNRYGQVVFQTKGNLRWDGRFKGATLPSGAYVYVLRYNGQLRNGVVMLIR